MLVFFVAAAGLLVGIWAEHKFDLYYRLDYQWRRLVDWMRYRR